MLVVCVYCVQYFRLGPAKTLTLLGRYTPDLGTSSAARELTGSRYEGRLEYAAL